MIPLGTTEPTDCGVPDCGNLRCNDCGERMVCTGPEPLPRCSEHPTCERCDGPVWCPECLEILAERAQDREDERRFDMARDERWES